MRCLPRAAQCVAIGTCFAHRPSELFDGGSALIHDAQGNVVVTCRWASHPPDGNQGRDRRSDREGEQAGCHWRGHGAERVSPTTPMTTDASRLPLRRAVAGGLCAREVLVGGDYELASDSSTGSSSSLNG